MYTASNTTVLYSGADRAVLLDVLFMVSGISRTPTTVSLLRGGGLLSRTTHAPVVGGGHRGKSSNRMSGGCFFFIISFMISRQGQRKSVRVNISCFCLDVT